MISRDKNKNALDFQPKAFTSTRTNIAIYGVVLLIMISVGRIQEMIPGLAVLKLGKVAFGLAFMLYFISPKRSDVEVFSSPQMKYAFFIFLLGLVSTPFSFWPGQSYNFMLFKFSTTFLFLFLILKIATTYADMKKITWGIIISLMVLGAKSLLSGGDRITSGGGTYDPNDLAFIMVLFLPLFYFCMKNERGILRWLLVVVLMVAIATIIATQSRSGFLGTVIVALGIAIKERMNLVKIMLGAGIMALLFSFFASTDYGERISTIFTPEQDYNTSASGGRIAIWKRGLQLMLENPVLGVGPFVFEVAEGTKHIDESTGTTGKWSAAHNSFIQIGAELGITGLILFVMMLVSSIRSLRRLQRDLPVDSELRWIVYALEVGLYGYIVCGFFISQAYSAALFLMVGLTVVVSNIVERERKDLVELDVGRL